MPSRRPIEKAFRFHRTPAENRSRFSEQRMKTTVRKLIRTTTGGRVEFPSLFQPVCLSPFGGKLQVLLRLGYATPVCCCCWCWMMDARCCMWCKFTQRSLFRLNEMESRCSRGVFLRWFNFTGRHCEVKLREIRLMQVLTSVHFVELSNSK